MGDGWTIVTKDRSLSAQWEHTMLVTPDGYEVLTLGGSPAPPTSSGMAGRPHDRLCRDGCPAGRAA